MTPRDIPETTASLLSLRGCHRVTLMPEMRRTRLSLKLNRNPVNSLELPKLIPHLWEGMSRLWPESGLLPANKNNKARPAAAPAPVRRCVHFLMGCLPIDGVKKSFHSNKNTIFHKKWFPPAPI
jgi:hypothetical protein